MALFQSKEDKKQEQLEEFRKKFHMEELSEEDFEIVQKIANDLAGNGWLKVGVAFGSDAGTTAQVNYQSALVEQNWLIIKQLSRLNSNIEKLLNNNYEE